jgi:hypothetical protein
VDNEEQVRYPDVPSYLEYVHNRQVLSIFALLNAVLFGFRWCAYETSPNFYCHFLYLKYLCSQLLVHTCKLSEVHYVYISRINSWNHLSICYTLRWFIFDLWTDPRKMTFPWRCKHLGTILPDSWCRNLYTIMLNSPSLFLYS